jgi:uncharacterized protein YjiS (DUF1127 family)
MTTRIDHHTTTQTPGVLQALRAVLTLFSIARERRQLARLDDHILRDIGISRDEAETEASRVGWDAPAHWRDGRGSRT